MDSFDRSFAAAARQTTRLEAALADWQLDEESDLPGDLAAAMWCENTCPSQMIHHEERLQGWLN